MDMNFEWRTRTEKILVVDYWWEEQKGNCCICQKQMLPYIRDHTKNPLRASIEHLKPRRDGGPNTVGNVRLAHAKCNNALGGLWSINQVRKNSGLEPLTEAWALENDARLPERVTARTMRNKRRSKPSKELIAATVEQDARLRKGGVSWNAGNALSLPRGATLLPAMQDKLRLIVKNRIPAPKMTALETARWLSEKGIRGS